MADEKKGLRSDYGTDGVHPNKQGYSVMEQVVRETIPGII
jgi:lysophospholipase L1-like esterase